MRAAIITSSDSGYAGKREDVSGPVIAEMVREAGYEVVWQKVLPDEQAMLEEAMKEICDEGKADLLLTTGGTGFSPRDVMPVATLTVGWPDEHPEQTDRLPLEAVVHEETYHDYIPETIDRYYGPKEQLPENRHFVEINHKETLAQIFTDIRYTRKDNEAMSRGMLEALKRQGFLD